MTDTQSLQTALETALTATIGHGVTINNLTLIVGGSSQETWRLDAEVAEGPLRGEHRLILRRPLGGSIYDTSLDLRREYAALSAAVATGVPSPRPFALLDDLLGGPATLVERLEAESIGRKIVREPRWEAARALLPAQMGEALAAIHRVDLEAHGLLELLPGPQPGQTPAQMKMAQIEAELDDIDEPHPALEFCLRWLRRNEPPPPERLVLVHGDYRIGNILVHPAEGMVGVIDWEFTHIGDYAEDLTWGQIREWRFGNDGLKLGGIGQPDGFYAAYAVHGGQPVNQQRTHYWEVMNNVWWAIGTLNQARRHLRGEERNIEFASLGRRSAEIELEALRLVNSK
jgi:aminoglycoside phosphotransferase (APT) family kinase protein